MDRKITVYDRGLQLGVMGPPTGTCYRAPNCLSPAPRKRASGPVISVPISRCSESPYLDGVEGDFHVEDVVDFGRRHFRHLVLVVEKLAFRIVEDADEVVSGE